MRQVNLREVEQKLVVSVANKTQKWDREFIIYQWYVKQDRNSESKYKIIFDLLNLTQKFVKVEKQRIDELTSDKTVTYLNIEDFQKLDLLNIPFIAKRRSILGNLHLDYFLYSNLICEFLMELEEDEDKRTSIPKEINILKDVSTDRQYHNINMAISYSKIHENELNFLFKLF